jgi:hypothetical protein
MLSQASLTGPTGQSGPPQELVPRIFRTEPFNFRRKFPEFLAQCKHPKYEPRGIFYVAVISDKADVLLDATCNGATQCYNIDWRGAQEICEKVFKFGSLHLKCRFLFFLKG